jgi:hypothetical protein
VTVTAAPTLTIAGETVPAGGPGALVGVGELRISWGRGGALEAPTPATAAVTVLDRSPGAVFARRTDLLGQPVLLGWTSGATSRTNFRGRVTDVAVTRRKAGEFLVTLSASSVEVELANHTAPANTAWPAETFGDRIARIRALIPARLLTGGVSVAFWTSYGPVSGVPSVLPDAMPCAPADVSGASALDLLTELSWSLHPTPLVYNPQSDALAPVVRRRYPRGNAAGVTMSAALVTDPNRAGRYVAAALPVPAAGTPGLHLDGHQLAYGGGLGQPIDARITRVELSYLDSAAAYGQRTATSGTPAAQLENVIGRRVLSVATLHASATNAAGLAALYADIAGREAAAPRLAPIGYSTAREPFPDLAHATVLLAGCELPQSVFMSGSWMTALGSRPLFGIIGGQIRYSAGQWELDLTPAAVAVDPAPTSWAPLTIARAASSSAVLLRDVDPSVTFGDCGFLDVGAGFTTATQPAYAGNPSL